MQPYKDIEDLLVSIGICAPPDTTIWYKKARYKFTAALLLGVCLFGTLSDTLGIIHSEDLTTFLNHTAELLSLLYVDCLIVVGTIYREQLKQIFLELHRNYDQCKSTINKTSLKFLIIIDFFTDKDDDCLKYLIRSDKVGRRATKFLVKYFTLSVLCICLLEVMYALAYAYWKDGYIDAKKLSLSHPVL